MPHRTLAAALPLALAALTLLACSQTAPTAVPETTPAPVATEPLTTAPTPTPDPTPTATAEPMATPRPTRRPTLNPASVAATLTSESHRLATLTAQLATPVPISIPTLAPPTLVVITIPPPTPVTITLPTIAPPPTISIPTIVVPTLAPPPLPTITVPTLAPPTFPPPTFPPRATTALPTLPRGVLAFAETCGEVRAAGDEVVTEAEFEEWVELLQTVEAPLALSDFWSGYVNQFALQDEYGPNESTQDAADDEMWAIVAMTQAVQDTLMDAGCLTGYDVALAYRTVEAWDRLVSGYGQGPDTGLAEFAKACNDMKTTVPAMDVVSETPWHLFYWWTQFVPPPEIVGYYDAVLALYREWALAGTGNVDDVSNESAMAVVKAAEALDEDALDLLLRERCAG